MPFRSTTASSRLPHSQTKAAAQSFTFDCKKAIPSSPVSRLLTSSSGVRSSRRGRKNQAPSARTLPAAQRQRRPCSPQCRDRTGRPRARASDCRESFPPGGRCPDRPQNQSAPTRFRFPGRRRAHCLHGEKNAPRPRNPVPLRKRLSTRRQEKRSPDQAKSSPARSDGQKVLKAGFLRFDAGKKCRDAVQKNPSFRISVIQQLFGILKNPVNRAGRIQPLGAAETRRSIRPAR